MTATKTNVLLKIDSTPLSDEPLVLRMQSHGRKLRGSAFPTDPRSKGAVRFRATGGTGGYVFSIEDSSAYDGLPPGLSLNATSGMITGTPTTVGRFRFRGKVQDSSATVAEEDFTIDIVGRLIGVNVTPVDGEDLVAYSYLFQVTGNTGVVTWSGPISGNFPSGLSLSSAGLLSGAPSPDGISYFVIRAIDADTGDMLDITCRIRIAPFLNFLFEYRISALVGIPFSWAPPINGATGVSPMQIAYSDWQDIDGTPITQPSYLTIGLGGVLSGTAPVPDMFSAVFTVVDAAGATSGSTIVFRATSPAIQPQKNSINVGTLTGPTNLNFVEGDGISIVATNDGTTATYEISATGGGDSGGPADSVSVAEVRRITALRAY